MNSVDVDYDGKGEVVPVFALVFIGLFFIPVLCFDEEIRDGTRGKMVY
jgi:hypothetical protein